LLDNFIDGRVQFVLYSEINTIIIKELLKLFLSKIKYYHERINKNKQKFEIQRIDNFNYEMKNNFLIKDKRNIIYKKILKEIGIKNLQIIRKQTNSRYYSFLKKIFEYKGGIIEYTVAEINFILSKLIPTSLKYEDQYLLIVGSEFIVIKNKEIYEQEIEEIEFLTEIESRCNILINNVDIIKGIKVFFPSCLGMIYRIMDNEKVYKEIKIKKEEEDEVVYTSSLDFYYNHVNRFVNNIIEYNQIKENYQFEFLDEIKIIDNFLEIDKFEEFFKLIVLKLKEVLDEKIQKEMVIEENNELEFEVIKEDKKLKNNQTKIYFDQQEFKNLYLKIGANYILKNINKNKIKMDRISLYRYYLKLKEEEFLKEKLKKRLKEKYELDKIEVFRNKLEEFNQMIKTNYKDFTINRINDFLILYEKEMIKKLQKLYDDFYLEKIKEGKIEN